MIETAEVQPNAGGSTRERESWVKTREKRKRRARVPALRITSGRSHSTLNKEATAILTQEGEVYCYMIVEDGKLRMQPLPMEPGCMGIARIHPRDGKMGAFIGVKAEILEAIGGKPGDRLVGTWDDAEGLMTFEVERV